MTSLLDHHKIKKTQAQVDFLIPFLDLDRRYFLDPSLLRFSKTSQLINWNQEIIHFLELVNSVIKHKDTLSLNDLLNIGEAKHAGLGYCGSGLSGNGVGKIIARNISKILFRNPEFKSRGFLRLEELQWLDIFIGPDRISDLAIHILMKHIIEYTQKQSRLIGIPLEEVRVHKVFYPDSLEWGPLKTKLPVNPLEISKDTVNKHPPIILLPKEILKTLPLFLHYDDFHGFIDPEKSSKSKRLLIEKAIKEPKISERYINKRENQAEKLYRPNFDKEIHTLTDTLTTVEEGKKQAIKFQKIIGRLIDFIFDDLNLFDQEQSTALKDIRRDLVYKNNATGGFFSDLKSLYKASHIIVDAKNTQHVTPKDISRVADYLNDDVGRVAFIVLRKKVERKLINHSISQLNKQKKVIIFLTDVEIKKWARAKAKILHKSGEEISTWDPIKSLSNKFSRLVTIS